MPKIICISDTHSNTPKVPMGDILIIAGDITGNGSESQVRSTLQWLGSLEHPVKLLTPGNHDWLFQRETQKARELCEEHGITLLIDEGYRTHGLSFWGSPHQPEFFDWAFNLKRGRQIAAKWALIPPDTDVIITHGPPMGILDEAPNGYNVGCEDLYATLKQIQPKLHVFGHIHHSYGVTQAAGFRTLFVNASTCDERYSCCNPPVTIHL